MVARISQKVREILSGRRQEAVKSIASAGVDTPKALADAVARGDINESEIEAIERILAQRRKLEAAAAGLAEKERAALDAARRVNERRQKFLTYWQAENAALMTLDAEVHGLSHKAECARQAHEELQALEAEHRDLFGGKMLNLNEVTPVYAGATCPHHDPAAPRHGFSATAFAVECARRHALIEAEFAKRCAAYQTAYSVWAEQTKSVFGRIVGTDDPPAPPQFPTWRELMEANAK